jgi:hypothetical protein
VQPPRAQRFIETAKPKAGSRATLVGTHLHSEVNEMPSSSVSLEKPRSIAAHTGTQGAGGLRGDLFLPSLSDPDPCIAPIAHKRRDTGWIQNYEDTHRRGVRP